MADFRTDFENFQTKWDQAMKDGVFDDAKGPVKPEPQTDIADYFPAKSATPNVEVNTEKYWARLAAAGKKGKHFVDVVEEDEEEEDENDSRINEAEEVAVVPNPVKLWTLGKDSDLQVTANGLGGEDFEKLEQMKLDLDSMIGRVNAAEAKGSTGQIRSLRLKIESLQERIDDLSDTLSYERLKIKKSRGSR